jgi:hypothetical protein
MSVVMAPRREATAAESTRGRTVDHTLCAAAYLWEWFAGYVVQAFDGEPARVWAPSCTVDPVALMRHAVYARRIRRYRDLTLFTLVVATPAALALHVAMSYGPAPALVLAVATAGAWVGRPALAAWLHAGWAMVRDGIREHRPGDLGRIFALAVAAALVLAIVARSQEFWYCLGIAGGGAVLGWSVTVVEYVWRWYRARTVRSTTDAVRNLAPGLPPAMEDRLSRLAAMNVVVYHAARSRNPFIGNGFQVRPWRLDLDVTKGVTNSDGTTQVPKDVDIVDLHGFLADQFAIETAVEATASRQLYSGHRLYVDGSRIPWGDALLTGTPPFPREQLDWEEIVEELRRPEDADHRRVYFYLQEIGRHGDIAVTMFVRPQLNGHLLSIEFVPQVILPVDEDMEAAVRYVSGHVLDWLSAAVWYATRATPRLMSSSPARCMGGIRSRLRVRACERRWRLATRRERLHDFGAVLSVRERVSLKQEKESLSRFSMADLEAINSHLRTRLLDSIKEYLNRLGIDTNLVDDRTVYIQSWTFGDVWAGVASFGNYNDFIDGTGGPGKGTGTSDGRDAA